MNSTNHPAAKNITQLTFEEQRAREKALDFYRFVGKKEAEAQRLASADVQKAFPRLKDCDVPAEIEQETRDPHRT